MTDDEYSYIKICDNNKYYLNPDTRVDWFVMPSGILMIENWQLILHDNRSGFIWNYARFDLILISSGEYEVSAYQTVRHSDC